ncbi:hypothetical protein [Spiroplasma endosymbiont of Lariophagus distinguendus]|uniref:hypothetical protein n=1 Tax=Spiroplasma endosymbiont of Lariophagus distinguendus TaxID=2935082 RepID=UPI002079EBD7|nr:hypothetical protein [Spiroplasma endosymbiont of Lariophagus distinguendus]
MNQNFSEKNIILLENIVLKIIGYGVGGILCVIGIITMASHVYLKLPYPYWLIIGLVSTIIGFILVMTHTIFNFIIKLMKIKKEK